MIPELLVWLAVYALGHSLEVLTAAVVSGTALLLAWVRSESMGRAMPVRQEILRWACLIRLLYRLAILGSLTIVTSTLMLLTGQWRQWVVATAVFVVCVLGWRWLRAGRSRPAPVTASPARVPSAPGDPRRR